MGIHWQTLRKWVLQIGFNFRAKWLHQQFKKWPHANRQLQPFKWKKVLWEFGKLLLYIKVIKAKCLGLAIRALSILCRNMVEQNSIMISIYIILFNLQEFPESLKDHTYLKEWHVSNTLIQTIPNYIALFQDLRVLELSKNQINHLPVEIGMLVQIIQLFICVLSN